MRCFLFILFSLLLLTVPCATAQKHTTKSIKKQQLDTQKAIKETNKKIESNTAKTKRSLNELNLIKAEIKDHEKTISNLRHELDSINRKLNLIQDSIKKGKNKINSLADNYARAIRSIQAQSSSFDRILFIFSATSFNQAYRRMRYLQQFSTWKDKQIEEIKSEQQKLTEQQNKIEQFRKQRSKALAKQNDERLSLVKKRKQQDKVVSSLKKEGKQLKQFLAEKQRQAKKLDETLNKLIAEEQRKAAEKAKQEAEKQRLAEEKKKQDKTKKEDKAQAEKPIVAKNEATKQIELSGNFESNKGNLLFPVSESYKIVRPFGRSKHPELKYVQTENNGIDIEVPAGTNARAVFDGKVSAIFPQDGFNTVVMVRHGNYLTIYVNLSEIYVKSGQAIKANQPIGKIFSDPEDNNRTILHFEVRHERIKLNPQEWLKQ